MSGADFVGILPLAILAAAAVLVLLVLSVYRSHLLTCILTLLSLAAAAASLPVAASVGPRGVTILLISDGYALFYTGIILAATFSVTVLSYIFLRSRPGRREELYLLLLLAALGAAVLVFSSHFASLFLGLELLSSSLFVLIAYPRGILNVEAGIKYLILASVSTAFLLFGMSLVYAQLGTMEFARIAAAGRGAGGAILIAGLGLLAVGLAFKLALVPFHMWAPDIYQGAPAPVTAFVASVSKVGAFGVLLRFFRLAGVQGHGHLFLMFTLIAIASMFGGNLLALLQGNVRRLLAYSSISHLGYLLVAFLASGALSVTAVTFYLLAYTATIVAAFGVAVLVEGNGAAGAIADYRGLFWRRPWTAVVMAGALFSLAGIPLTAGFIGKFYLIGAGAGSSLWLLVLALVISSGIGVYYYLRLIVIMYLRPEQTAPETAPAPWSGSLILGALFLAILWLGVYPAPWIDMIQRNALLK
ncbi:MAG: NADH-quinone oxidoreductase subunit N [Actinobacteria bacterium]|nr:NADH-quinone oxidoreductase subunit N [Actinomycetota bacterium]